MSFKIKGLRRAGIVGLSTVVAISMTTGLAVTASALPPAYTALSAPNVARATAQPAGSLTLDFTNSFVTNAAQTFTISGNNCATAPGIAAATGFTANPTSAVAGPFIANGTTAGTATVPGFTSLLGSSSTQCATAGIKDQVTLTLTSPSSVAGPTDWFKYTLSTVVYNVGASAPLGNLNVATSGALRANASVVNAVVAGTTHTSPGTVLAVPSTPGVSLGTQTLVENSPGAFFGAGGSTTTVVLTLSGTSTFTAGVTPTVTLPTGYTHTTVVTTGIGTYTFAVTSPATPVAATMTVSGLTISASATATDVMLAITGGVANPAALKAVRVINYTARTGGSDRFATAAALFTNQFGPTNGNVVLSSGVDFPDALSANYLAKRLTTGTLLTTPSTLSSAARTAIINASVTTVYITGGTGAVSQGVEDQITGLHVNNNSAKPFINVVRLGGADRYATNLVSNENNFLHADTVLLASGEDFPDALALGPVAYQKTFPLILTRGKVLGATEMSQLADFNPTNVIIAGGVGVVSAAIETSLRAQGYTVVRLAGQDRSQTAAAVATWATATPGFVSGTTYIARGDDFADALAAGPVAGANNQVIVLTTSTNVLGAGIPAYLGTKTVGTATTQVAVLHALGLTGAVSNPMMRAAAVTVGP
ncbi:MAG: cell wall-binding repeat-containing protein [Dermatophilaceae bacterium]